MFNLKLQRNKIFIAPILLFGMVIFNFNIGVTNAYFSDTETSSGNTLSTGILSISLDNQNTFSSGLLYPSDSITAPTISISNTGSLNSQYIASTALLGADTTACDYVTMIATSPTSIPYTGLIKDFVSTATPTTATTWNFSFTVSATAPPSVWGKTCFFKWVYTAWQDNLPDASSGFSSVKQKLGSVKIGKAIVLNEVLPNPIGPDDALMPNGEWVELYNNSNLSFDLNGWYLYDSTDTGELPIDVSHTGTTTTIAPHGWLVVYRNGDGNFVLDDATDSIRLLTNKISSSGILLDSYSWTTEKPEGFSYARIPDGVGAWVDPIPTPGASNELTEEIIPEKPAEEIIPDPVIPDPAPEPTPDPVITPDPIVSDPATEPAPDPVVTPDPAVASDPAEDPVVETVPAVVEPEPQPEVSQPTTETLAPVPEPDSTSSPQAAPEITTS